MDHKLDPESLVGLVVSEAKETAERHGYAVEIFPPGRSAFTLDLRPGRMRLVTDGTMVTKAWSG